MLTLMDPLTVDLRNPAFWQDPYPLWRAARAQHRTARTTAGEVVLLDAADLDVAASDAAFAQLGLESLHRLGITDGPFHEWRRLTLAVLDGEQHERLRSVVGRSFTPRRTDLLRAAIRAHADECSTARWTQAVSTSSRTSRHRSRSG